LSPSVLFDQTAQSDHIIDVDGCYGSHQLPLGQLGVLEGHPPGLPVLEVLQRSNHHVKAQTYYISRLQLGAVLGAGRVAAVPCLAVIDAPAVDRIRKGLLQVEGSGPADPYLDKLPFVDEKFEVVPPSSREDLCPGGGFEAAAFLGKADKAILIKFEFGASFVRVPAEKGCIGQ